MSSSFPQHATGPMTYPAKGTLNRLLFKTPLLWWRAGLGPVLGRFMLAFTTWGRRSKLPRHTMASYSFENGRYYLLSGWGERTDWVRNMLADPHVTVQDGKRTVNTLARRVTGVDEYAPIMADILRTGGDTHFRPWLKSLDIAYDLDDLIAKRDRVYLIALDPADEPGPPPMEADLVWVWAAMGAAFAMGWVLGRMRRGGEPPPVHRGA